MEKEDGDKRRETVRGKLERVALLFSRIVATERAGFQHYIQSFSNAPQPKTTAVHLLSTKLLLLLILQQRRIHTLGSSGGRIGREGGVLNKVLGAGVSHRKVLAGFDEIL